MKKEFYDNLEGKVYLLLVFEFTFVISATYLVRTNQRSQMVRKTYKIARLFQRHFSNKLPTYQTSQKQSPVKL